MDITMMNGETEDWNRPMFKGINPWFCSRCAPALSGVGTPSVEESKRILAHYVRFEAKSEDNTNISHTVRRVCTLYSTKLREPTGFRARPKPTAIGKGTTTRYWPYDCSTVVLETNTGTGNIYDFTETVRKRSHTAHSEFGDTRCTT